MKTETALNYTVEQISPILIEVRMKYKQGFNQPFLLTSDVHFDNPKCDRKKYFKDLDKAVEKGAGVFCFGDFYCLMQGKYDPRRSKKGVRPEHQKENYFDIVQTDTADLLSPYADNLVLFSDGNHETSVLKRMESNPLDRLAERLNLIHGGNLKRGKYQGFVRFVFEHESGGRVRTKTLAYHHGAWGGVITKGVLSVSRYASIYPDADIVVSGHTHDEWIVKHQRFKISQSGEIRNEYQLHIKTATYKEEFLEGGGWAVERITMPKAIGGVWLDFIYEDGEIKERTYMT